MAAHGVILVRTATTITEGVDVLDAPASGGLVTVQATGSATEGVDTVASTSQVGSQRVATLVGTEGDDTLTTLTLTSSPRTATTAITEGTDTSSAAAAITPFPQINAALVQSESSDTLAATTQNGALLARNGAAALTEAGDTFASTASALAAQVSGALATAAGTELPDTLFTVTQTDNVINGIAIGAVGTGTLLNFKLIAGDDFIAPVKFWNVHQPVSTRTYANFHFNGSRQDPTPGSVSTNILAMDIDPYWRGPRSASPGGTPVDPTSVANSVLTITMKKPDDATLIATLPTTFDPAIGNTGGKPALQTVHLRTGPYFQYSGKGDWCCEAVYEAAAGPAVGYWFGPWETTVAAWPDFGEWDFGETTTNITTGVKTYDTGFHISDVDGGADVGTVPLALTDIPVDRPVWVRVIKTATKVEQWDDVAVQGTLALRYTYTNTTRIARMRGGHHIRFDGGCDLAWHGGTFVPAQWPKTVKYHWWRVWGPSSGRDWVAPTDLGTAVLAVGEAWSYTLPSPTTLYGAVPDYEEVIYTTDGMDVPGFLTRNTSIQRNTTVTPPVIYRTLGGMTYTPTTRVLSGAFPSGEGGRIGVQMVGSFATGGACRMAYRWFEVAPNVQPTLFADFTMTQGTAIATKTIVYADFHSGNLGPHVYTVTFTSGGAGLTITGSGTATVTVSGTPTDTSDAVIQIVATNAKGQSTTVTRLADNTVAVGPVMTMNFVTDTYVFGGTTYTSWANALASGHWTFARALKAYYINSVGTVIEYATGTLRTGLAGFRCEPARTQLAKGPTSTMDMTGQPTAGTAYATGVTSTPNNQTGPNGTANVADTQNCTVVASQHYIGQNSAAGGNNYTAGTTYEQTIFLKKGNHRYIQIQVPTSVTPSGLPYMNIDFDTPTTSLGGTGILTSQFKALGSGWFLAGITFVAEATVGNGCVQICFLDPAVGMSSTRNPSWAGTSGATVITWQLQQAVGNKLTYPIDNTSNSANLTRPADDLGIVLPTGTWNIRVTFMDNTTQLFTGVSGTYHLPASSLNQFDIKTIAME